MNTELIPRTTLTEMCAAYRQSEADIRQAYGLIAQAEDRLKNAFDKDGYGFRMSPGKGVYDNEHHEYTEPDKIMGQLKKQAWRILVNRMELRRVLSIKRAEELDKQLETGKDLPEIEESQILAMLEGTLNNVSLYIEEAVKEVFEYLRPPHSRYKTNSEFEIRNRVILRCAVDIQWSGGKFRPAYYQDKNLRAIDNVFHALDGNGTIKTHRGPLIDAIEAAPDGKGETQYFKFTCHKNQNLHLEFKRLDLVAKLNAVAGGMRLKPEN